MRVSPMRLLPGLLLAEAIEPYDLGAAGRLVIVVAVRLSFARSIDGHRAWAGRRLRRLALSRFDRNGRSDLRLRCFGLFFFIFRNNGRELQAEFNGRIEKAGNGVEGYA